MSTNILLISPYANNEALWVTGDDAAISETLNNFPPLGLATVAGLTPTDGYVVQIWDELVHGRITDETEFARDYDLVGVTGYGMHRPRAIELAQIFRRRGIPTAVGGPGASSSPRDYAQDFTVVFEGEVEHTWPQFLRDFGGGQYKSAYHQIDKPDLAQSPLPVWDSIRAEMKHYGMGAIQTTRGCPYDCEFCDVIYLFGRRQRHKPIPVVMEELRRMASFGYEWVFFCDDEFGGDKKYAKDLLREIIAFNKTLDKRVRFSTQMCITASSDLEFCELLGEANFDMVFIGIESANPESLRSANKLQNLKGDLVENIHTLLRYGIGIRAGMIVGFDEDDASIFETTVRFLQKACLPSIGVYMLMAPVGTRLWMRLMHEGRVLSLARNKDLGPARARTNIIPNKLSRMELYRGYRWLLANIYSWENFAERICGFVSLASGARCDQRGDREVDAEALIASLGLEGSAVEATRRILAHTREVAPDRMSGVKDLIVQHARYQKSIRETLDALDYNVRREEAGEMLLDPFTKAVPLPLSFKPELSRILPRVHRRVYVNLSDKDAAPAALVDVFVEFLLRVGDGFEEFGDHHMMLLDELCDRHCAAYNRVPAVDFRPLSDEEMAARDVPSPKRVRLVDDIFKGVFQKLAALHQEGRDMPHTRASGAQ